MKKIFRISTGILLIISIFLIHSCKKDKPTPPVISAVRISSISYSTAISGGNIIDEGGATISARGVCWSTTPNPTISLNTITFDGTGTGAFTSSITGLTAGTIYYVKAYATNSVGTAYGTQLSFTTTTAKVPFLISTAVSSITQTTAMSGGLIASDGGTSVIACGVCWSTSSSPTIALGTKTTDNIESGSYTSSISGLAAGTIYYVRAYATNSVGTAYGNEISFTSTPTTVPGAPTIGTAAAGNSQATISFTIPASNGGSVITGYTVTSSPGSLTGTGTESPITVSGLTNGTAYTFTVSAVNAIGNSLASSASNSVTPSVPTSAPGAPTIGTATAGNAQATVNFTAPANNGGSVITGYMVTANPGSITGTGTASPITVSGLTNGTAYTFTVKATNATGTSVASAASNSVTPTAPLTVPPTVPVLTTTALSEITQTTATSGGNITSDGGATVSARGICWSNSTNPTIALSTKTSDGTAAGAFISVVTGLTAGTTYYLRAYATNSAGTGYGSSVTFTTLSNPITFNPNLTYGSVTDYDWNTYKTITIGTQVWMAENLKTTKYNDGTPIPKITDNTLWAALTTGAYCDNDNIPANSTTYGRLYNWYTVDNNAATKVASNGGKNVCPTGWHIPTEDEWTTLTDYLTNNGYGYGGSGNDIGKSMAGMSGWSTSWTPGTVGNDQANNNNSGFTALPSGGREGGGTLSGIFISVSGRCSWWTSYDCSTTDASNRMLYSEYGLVYSYYTSLKQNGNSVRCLQGEYSQTLVSTIDATSITSTTATSGGIVTSDGGAAVTVRGVVWSTSANPTTALSTKTSDGTGTGPFTSSITGLSAGTLYYVCAYATNINGTAYGNQISFTTNSATIPVITTTAASEITQTSASSGGNITSHGGATVTARGVCWSTSASPTIALSTKTSDNSGTGIFSSSIIGLTAGTIYYVRAYATNSVGTAYGTQISFTTTSATVPIITTTIATEITQSTATSGGNISSDGGATITARGICWDITINPTIALSTKTNDGTGTGSYVSSITGLTSGHGYWIRAYATNSVGTIYGENVNFVANNAPQIITTAISSITQTTAMSGGTISSGGGTISPITSRGICWSTSSNPTIALSTKTTDNSGTGIYISSMSNLQMNTKYYVKAYATAGSETSYGDEIVFATPGITGTITDVNGNIYSTIEIGEQVWMAENLKTTMYRNGDLIGTTPPGTMDIQVEYTPKYQWTYGNNESNASTFGRLYTGFAIIDPRNVCPIGWHIPSDAEWTKLTDYLGGEFPAGWKLKEIGTAHWQSPNSGATNEMGFTALPGGYRYYGGSFQLIGNNGFWWSSNLDHEWTRQMDAVNGWVTRSSNTILSGLSVRCVDGESPTVITNPVSNLTPNSVSIGGNIILNGDVPVTERGVYWKHFKNHGIEVGATKIPIGSGTGGFTSSLSGLTAGNTYYIRAYATHSYGVSYGDEISFTTPTSSVPVITTAVASSITQSTATCGGNVSSDGGASVTARGICWSTTTNPTISLSTKTINGTGTGTFTSSITGLVSGTIYYVRAYATNSVGTSYGNEISFTSAASIVPALTTAAASAITQTTATSGGNITSDGGASVTARGICWSTTFDPTIALTTKTSNGTGTGSFSSSLASLAPGTTYYVRAYATNDIGTAYGSQISFKTTSTLTVADIEGNIYNTVTIGSQTWMAENLRVTKYNNGASIGTTNPYNLNISGESYPYQNYQWAYQGDESNVATYGRLYTFGVVTDNRKVCPTGWHVPTDAEWTTIENYLIANGYNYDRTTSGNKIAKALASATLWATTTSVGAIGNTDYSEKIDMTGFTAIPVGYRSVVGTFRPSGTSEIWWSATKMDDLHGWFRSLSYNYNYTYRYWEEHQFGFSVRCVKD